jgi:glycogen operon protein
MIGHDATFSLNQLLEHARLDWHGVTLGRPDWADHSHSLAFTLRTIETRFLLHVMLNAYWEPLEFEVPPATDAESPGWRRCIDTAAPSPDDAALWTDAPGHGTGRCVVQPRSLVLLAARLKETAAHEPKTVVS